MRQRSFFLVIALVLLAFLSTGYGLEEKTSAQKAELRFEKLTKDSLAKKTALKLDSARLKTHASNSRNYSLIVFFTSDDPQVRCQMCKPIEKEYLSMVKSFYETFGVQVFQSSEFQKHPVFFATCDLHDCYDIFVQAEWKSIPKVVHIPPQTGRDSLNFRSWEEMELNELPTIETFASFVYEKTNFPFIPEKSFSEKYGTFLLGLFSGGFFLYSVYSKFRQPMFWFAVTMTIFAISMAGLVFNAINKPPFNYRHPYTGQLHFIYPNSRQQFQVEGGIMAALLSVISLLMVSFIHFVPKMKGVNQRIVFYVLLLITGAVYVLIWRIFQLKHPYYPFPI